MKTAVFLDRDGTLIRDGHYLSDPRAVVILPLVRESLVRLRKAGFLLIMVTNQSGIGRRYFKTDDFFEVNREVGRQLGLELDGVYFCPHGPDANCRCRKPAPGMIQQAAIDHRIDLGKSWMVGDAQRDAESGLQAGCRAILIGSTSATPNQQIEIVSDLPSAVDLILSDLPVHNP